MGTSTAACCILQCLNQLQNVRGTKLIIIFIVTNRVSNFSNLYTKFEAGSKSQGCASGVKGKVFEWQLSPTPDRQKVENSSKARRKQHANSCSVR